MTYTTQCPNCQTRFKVNDAQLSAAKGLVRCGRCSHVFNATEHFVSNVQAQPVRQEIPPVAPPPLNVPPAPIASTMAAAPAAVDPMDDFELELPDFDPLTSSVEIESDSLAHSDIDNNEMSFSHQEEPAPQPEPADAEEFQRALAEAMSHRQAIAPQALSSATITDDGALPDVFGNRRRVEPELPAETSVGIPFDLPENLPHYANQSEHDSLLTDRDSTTEVENKSHPVRTTLLGLLAAIGGIVLLGQLIYFNRTRIAAEAPELRPMLEQTCKALGCTVPWPTDLAFIRTEWSELSFVPEHPNLIQLSATLKNHASYAQTYPMLEVSLKDADDQVLIRKVFTPKEYLRSDDFKLQRFNSNSEVKVTMRLDAGQVHAMGYSLYWFYP